MGRFPFGIPNGWYLLFYSDELPAGEVRPVRAFGEELVAFRTADGRAAVLDAYCPHLGAHLGHGGTVEEDGVRCPFHAWRWGADGECLAVPYAKRIPPNAAIRSYPVLERNGMLFAWYHAEGAGPSFEIPDIAEWHDDDYSRPWVRSEWTVRTHPQEMAENGIDWPHFATIHGTDMPEDRDYSFHDHCYRWRVGTEKSVSTLDGLRDALVMHGENWGLGYNWIKQNGHFETVVATGMTPIDGETTRVRMGVIARRSDGDRPIERAELEAYVREHSVFAEQDFVIWENKRFRPRPPLCEGDGPIAEFRRWAAQFYSA